jgi:hypothetical protein
LRVVSLGIQKTSNYLTILTTTKTKTQQRWNFIKEDLTIAESVKNMSEIG